MNGLKPGYKTTEFWLSAIPGALITALDIIGGSGLALPAWAGPVMMAAYAIARGLSKITVPTAG